MKMLKLLQGGETFHRSAAVCVLNRKLPVRCSKCQKLDQKKEPLLNVEEPFFLLGLDECLGLSLKSWTAVNFINERNECRGDTEASSVITSTRFEK